jgi:yecA family protein
MDDGAEIAVEWARGFIAGTAMCPEAWEPLVCGAESRVLLMPIYAQLPEYDGLWSAEAREDLTRLRRQARETIPPTVAAIADFWREQRELDQARWRGLRGNNRETAQ